MEKYKDAPESTLFRKKTSSSKWKGLTGQRGLEPASGAMITAEIARKQAEAAKELGRNLTDEEAERIASDVEHYWRNR